MKQQTEKTRRPILGANAKRVLCQTAATLLSPRASKRAAEKRAALNALQPVQGRYIFSQHKDAAHAVQFGKGDISGHGCGAIAVYNLLTDMGMQPQLHELLYRAERVGLPVAGGRLGSHPRRIGRLLAAYGTAAQYYAHEADFLQQFAAGERAVVCYWHAAADVWQGLHFVYIRAAQPPFCATVYNSLWRGHSDRPLHLHTADELWKKGVFLCAWKVTDAA